jgi:hypothetical protein
MPADSIEDSGRWPSCAGRLARDVESPPVWSPTGTDGRIRAVGPFVAFATG